MLACHVHNQIPTSLKYFLLIVLLACMVGLLALLVDIFRTKIREDS